MWITSNSNYTTTIVFKRVRRKKKNKGDDKSNVQRYIFVHVAALFLMTELNQLKKGKLAMLVVMINVKQSGIGEQQRGRHQLAYRGIIIFIFPIVLGSTFKVSSVELCLLIKLSLINKKAYGRKQHPPH